LDCIPPTPNRINPPVQFPCAHAAHEQETLRPQTSPACAACTSAATTTPTTVHGILDAATHCHVGHVIDGRPVVIPTLHWREGAEVFWHGSAASRMLKANARMEPVCLTATLIDGFVLARSAFHHSINYRSVMCFGTPRLVTDPDEKLAALAGFVNRLFPAAGRPCAPPPPRRSRPPPFLAMKIDEASAKIRNAPPATTPATDLADLGGVLPFAHPSAGAHARRPRHPDPAPARDPAPAAALTAHRPDTPARRPGDPAGGQTITRAHLHRPRRRAPATRLPRAAAALERATGHPVHTP
jgi:nitroimidazol reductase NimA-like FMN-containing flavoprotein (pyridoxamine 5'-phosphate oxidase superfamily)